jgi:PKD repeat protein
VGGTASFEVNATDTASDIPSLTYTWEFEDGKKLKGAKVDQVFTKPGSQKVKVTVEDDDGAIDSKTVTVTVKGEPEKPPDDGEDNTLLYGALGGVVIAMVVIILLYLFVIKKAAESDKGQKPSEPTKETEPEEETLPREEEEPAKDKTSEE